MNWYESFNFIEAALWMLVAVAVVIRTPRVTRHQRWGVALGAVSFAAFGVTDVIETGYQGSIPLWLWAFKVVCGVGILTARYTWRGWSTLRCRDREIRFGLGCLIAVVVVIVLQFWVVSGPDAGRDSTV